MKNKMISRDDMLSMSPAEYDRRQQAQFEVFERLQQIVDDTLERFGRPAFLAEQPRGDYSVHGDYTEYPQVVVFIHNLLLLRHPAVDALQQLLRDYPGWQIDLRVGLWDHLDDWPSMGISIHADEIVDELQRHYFPKEFQDIQYQGARRGKTI